MLIQHIRLADREGLWQIRCQDGVITAIEPHDEHAVAGRVLDGEGGLAIAPLSNPTFTSIPPRRRASRAGTSPAPCSRIERWAERKALLTHEDVKQRAIQTLKWQIANGIQFVRTHVDVSDPNLVALKAMLEVREEMKEWVELQIVAFPQEGILSYPNGKALLEEALKLGADVIGAIPTSSLPGNMGSKVCTTSSILPRRIRFWSMCTATRSMTSSPVSSRRWQLSPMSGVSAIG